MKRSHIIALLLIAIAIGVIISMVGDASTYENFTTAESVIGKEFHVVGKLSKEKPIEYNPKEDPNSFSFYMKDEDEVERKVIVHKSKPRDFEKSETVVVIGNMQNGTFDASNILLKCPSKYTENKLDVADSNGEY